MLQIEWDAFWALPSRQLQLCESRAELWVDGIDALAASQHVEVRATPDLPEYHTKSVRVATSSAQRGAKGAVF